jgi:hypothetical protein
MSKLYTKEQLVKKYHGKFIDVYPFYHSKKDKAGRWVAVYEVRQVSATIRENCNPPEEVQ